jgi:hypothetical protein
VNGLQGKCCAKEQLGPVLTRTLVEEGQEVVGTSDRGGDEVEVPGNLFGQDSAERRLLRLRF